MKKILFSIIILLITLFPYHVNATSGALKSDTIKECEGTLYGQHGSDNHWHVAVKNSNGSYSAKGNALESEPCPSNSNENLENNVDNKEVTTLEKSSDSTLKEILIDDEPVDIVKNMEYKTTKDKVNLVITANDANAKLDYNPVDNLQMGNNIVNITVTAEDLTTSNYVLIIVREKELDNNTNIKIKIAGEEIEFTDYKYALEVKNNVDSLDIDYQLESASSKASIEGNKDFVIGKNDVKIIVTAENGESQEYIITVTKLDWLNSLIKVILGSSVVVAIIAFVKKIFKK